MRVAFSENVLTDPSTFHHLDAILYIIAKGSHEWHIDDPEAVESSPWLQGARPLHRTLFEKAATRPVPTTARSRVHSKLLLVEKDCSPGSLAPDKAARFLEEPLKILMENRITDGAFLDTILTLLADPEVMHLKGECDKALAYDSPGGCGQLPKLVEDAHAEADQSNIPPRMVVFADSDSSWPGEFPKAADAIRQTCLRLGVPHVILSKRAIENYVPNEVIVEWRGEPSQTNLRPKIDALLRLTPAQRDHFHFKNGLRLANRKPEEHHPQEDQLYASLPPEDRGLLESGFGRKFIQILFVGETPTGEAATAKDGQLRPSLTAEALRLHDTRGDLDALVACIEEGL